jgi:hypothetical protein
MRLTSAPPKKRRTWLIVLVIILALMVIGIVGCLALAGTAGRAIDEGMTEASGEAEQSQQAEDNKNAPCEVTPGKAFTIGDYQTLAGWKVKQDSSLGEAQFTVTGKVKNVSDDTATALIHFKFIDSSSEVLANVQCNADLEAGQTLPLSCVPDGKYGKYEKVTAEAIF